MRRHRIDKRVTPPDPRFGSKLVHRFVNMVMVSGKKSIAERIVYG
ncbi:MAG: 30S ribosomal protein S7, partial [Polaromonas sp.]|nr:30S ribosomal protein S7 [Polaromonas sp.]